MLSPRNGVGQRYNAELFAVFRDQTDFVRLNLLINNMTIGRFGASRVAFYNSLSVCYQTAFLGDIGSQTFNKGVN